MTSSSCNIDRNDMLKDSHKTDSNNIPNIHDFHPPIEKNNQDIKYVWRNLPENPSTGREKNNYYCMLVTS